MPLWYESRGILIWLGLCMQHGLVCAVLREATPCAYTGATSLFNVLHAVSCMGTQNNVVRRTLL